MTELADTEIRERVRERYAAAAATSTDCCGGPSDKVEGHPATTQKDAQPVFGGSLYGEEADPAANAP